jgi:drug/metabolite transporter (DMT)-like permease
MKLNRQYLADLALLGTAFAWGTTFQLVQDALADIDTFPFLSIRFAAAFLILLPFRKEDFKWHPAALRAGFYLFCGYALQTLGLLWTTPSKAAFITGLNVILVPFMVAFLDRRFPSWTVLTGAGLAAAGLGFISLEGTFLPGKGDLLVLCCALFFALQILAVREASKTMEAQDLTLVQMGVVSLLSLGAWGGFGGNSINWTPAVIVALVVTSVFATALAFLCQSWAQRFTSAERVALLLTAEPVFAGLFSYFYGGEIFSTQKFIGCSLILAGILVSELTGMKKDVGSKKSDIGKVSEERDSVSYFSNGFR